LAVRGVTVHHIFRQEVVTAAELQRAIDCGDEYAFRDLAEVIAKAGQSGWQAIGLLALVAKPDLSRFCCSSNPTVMGGAELRRHLDLVVASPLLNPGTIDPDLREEPSHSATIVLFIVAVAHQTSSRSFISLREGCRPVAHLLADDRSGSAIGVAEDFTDGTIAEE
jgi:hypothetical protein